MIASTSTFFKSFYFIFRQGMSPHGRVMAVEVTVLIMVLALMNVVIGTAALWGNIVYRTLILGEP